MSALKELREKVADGTAEFDWGFATSPSRKAFPVNWHDASDAYHGSLDAAKALHEAELPGWFWTIQARMKIRYERPQEQDGWIARVWLGGDGQTAVADNPARAWLLALLDALIAKEDRADG